MVTPRIILLNDPTRGIDVGTKQEIYQLLRELADAGAAILFYSTDYDELIGCCDRVLVMYDGAIRRELVGDEITERALVASALNIATRDRGRPATRPAVRRMSGLALLAAPSSAARCSRSPSSSLMFAIYVSNHPAGFTANVVQTAANKGVLLALVAMAQTLVVLTAGHRPVGRHGLRAHQLPRLLHRRRRAAEAALGVLGVLAAGLACGAINGLIVIYGRLQPIVTTIATGAIFFGIALCAAARSRAAPTIQRRSRRRADRPALRAASRRASWRWSSIVLVVWVPFRRSASAAPPMPSGSSEVAAYMSGVPISGRSSSPTRSPACSPRSAGSSSPSSPIPARPPPPTAAPTRSTRSPRSCSAACRCSAASAAPSAPSSARSPSAPSATCSSSSTSSRCGSRCSRASCCSSRSASARRGCCAVRNRLDLFG